MYFVQGSKNLLLKNQENSTKKKKKKKKNESTNAIKIKDIVASLWAIGVYFIVHFLLSKWKKEKKKKDRFSCIRNLEREE